MTPEEQQRSTKDAFEKIGDLIERQRRTNMSLNCPDGLIPDGNKCPRCGGSRVLANYGETWVHFIPLEKREDMWRKERDDKANAERLRGQQWHASATAPQLMWYNILCNFVNHLEEAGVDVNFFPDAANQVVESTSEALAALFEERASFRL